MRQVTVSVNDETLAAYERYAAATRRSLEELLAEALESWRSFEGVAPGDVPPSDSKNDWVEDLINRMKRAGGNSGGRPFNRDELYDV